MKKLIARQLSHPKGILGFFIGRNLAKTNAPNNAETIDALDLQPADYVLEIGFGPGAAIEEVAKVATHVAGVDYSKGMVKAAGKRNKQAISEGRVELHHADAAHMPFNVHTFDKVFGVNVIYFWADPAAVLTELHRVLKPGGLCAIWMIKKELMANNPIGQTEYFTFYAGDEATTMFKKAGFSEVELIPHEMGTVVLGKK